MSAYTEEASVALGARSTRDVVATGDWVHDEYERSLALTIGEAPLRTIEMGVLGTTRTSIGLSSQNSRLVEIVRENSVSLAQVAEELRQLEVLRELMQALGTSSKRTQGSGKASLTTSMGMVSSVGRQHGGDRKLSPVIAIYLPPEMSGDPPDDGLGGIAENSYTPWYWHIQVHGAVDELYGSSLDLRKISVREGSVDPISIGLFMGEKILDLSGVDHVEIEFRDRQKRAFRYSSEDSPQRVVVVAPTLGRVTFTPPSTLFRTKGSPYEMYVWVFETSSIKFSIPEGDEALIEVSGNY